MFETPNPTPHMLRITGNAREMGRSHGMYAKERGALATVQFFGDFLNRVLSFQVQGEFERWSRHTAASFLRHTVERHFVDQIPARYREEVEGFSEGSGLDLDLLLRAYVMPDVLAFLVGSRYRYLTHGVSVPTPTGCSAFVAFDHGATAAPFFLHARNLDYIGGDLWSGAPAVIEYVPGDGQRYVSVTSLGIDTAGVTAMNEAGLTLSLNMNYSTAVSTGGTPVVAIGHEVLRRARSLKEAVEILNRFPRSAGWSFLVASHRERNAVVVECDATSLSVRAAKAGRIVATNHFHDPQLRRYEYWTTKGRGIDSQSRYERIHRLLEDHEGTLTVSRTMEILSDTHDLSLGRERAFGFVPCQVHTVASVIFEPLDNRVYVANGPAPVSESDFAGFEVFPGPFQRSPLLARPPKTTHNHARREYALAYQAYFPSQDLVKATDHLEKAVALDPEQSLYWIMLALVQAQRGRFSEAATAFRRADLSPETDYRKAQIALQGGRILDLLGDRGEALGFYRRALEEESLHSAARKGLKKSWSPKEARRLLLDFTLGEAIEN